MSLLVLLAILHVVYGAVMGYVAASSRSDLWWVKNRKAPVQWIAVVMIALLGLASLLVFIGYCFWLAAQGIGEVLGDFRRAWKQWGSMSVKK